MKCQRCDEKELTSKQEKFCSKRCSILAAKARYRKAHPEKMKEWKKKYYAGKPKITWRETSVILNRYNNKCVRCHSTVRLEVHHLRPATAGGDHAFDNLVPFCKLCHAEWHRRITDFWEHVQ